MKILRCYGNQRIMLERFSTWGALTISTTILSGRYHSLELCWANKTLVLSSFHFHINACCAILTEIANTHFCVSVAYFRATFASTYSLL